MFKLNSHIVIDRYTMIQSKAIWLVLSLWMMACRGILLPDEPNRLPSAWEKVEKRGEAQEYAHWDPCPEFTVKCVLDGDWRHPVGDIGKKRECILDL